MTWSTFLVDEAATVAFGEGLGAALAPGGVVYLEGTLGAGKTTLCRGVLRAFGYSGAVKSPTYTLVEAYEFPHASVFHFDLYRLGDPQELDFMGIRDYFLLNNVVLIEWPVRGQGYLPEADLRLSLNPQREGRKLEIETLSKRGVDVLTAIA